MFTNRNLIGIRKKSSQETKENELEKSILKLEKLYLRETMFLIYRMIPVIFLRRLQSERSFAIRMKKSFPNRAKKDAVIKELENRLAHELALKGHDGTNTGTPTSQTPIGKKKVIPNSRRNTGKKKGEQPGHEKHSV